MQPETESWWRQAMADLQTARSLLEGDRHYAASWFAQQAGEKGLKALFLESTGRIAPRTHDLEFLGQAIQAPTPIQQELARLNPAFDLVRYPDPITGTAPVDAVDNVLAIEHVAAAERVIAWLNQQLNPSLSNP